jgi:two-component system, NarL family, response regulator LiaR
LKAASSIKGFAMLLSSPTIRVLIADSHDFVRASLSILIETISDLELVGATPDGIRAVEMCKELQPDVALMGLQLLGIDGVAATRLIQAERPQTQVVILTSSILPEDEQVAVQAGASAYLRKDASSNDIISTIRAVCVNRRAS